MFMRTKQKTVLYMMICVQYLVVAVKSVEKHADYGCEAAARCELPGRDALDREGDANVM